MGKLGRAISLTLSRTGNNPRKRKQLENQKCYNDWSNISRWRQTRDLGFACLHAFALFLHQRNFSTRWSVRRESMEEMLERAFLFLVTREVNDNVLCQERISSQLHSTKGLINHQL